MNSPSNPSGTVRLSASHDAGCWYEDFFGENPVFLQWKIEQIPVIYQLYSPPTSKIHKVSKTISKEFSAYPVSS